VYLLTSQVFVETDSDVRLARRLKRDISQRGRDIHGVMQQYENHVKPAYDRYIAPTMQHADIIVPRYGSHLNQLRRIGDPDWLSTRIRIQYLGHSGSDPSRTFDAIFSNFSIKKLLLLFS
jgi:uridine kinase